MKITSNRQKELQKLDLNYQKELGKREKNLKNLNYLYGKKIKDIKYEGNRQIEKHQIAQREKVVKELSEENKRWDHVQNRLAQKKGQWERELNFLEAKQAGEVDYLKEKHLDKLDMEVYDHNKTLDNFDDKASQAMLDLKEEHRQLIAKEKMDSRFKIGSLKRQDERLEDQAIRNYSSFNQRQQRDLDKALKEKKIKYKETIRDMENKNYEQINTRQKLQKKNLDKINDVHNEILREREEILTTKINEIEQDHQSTLDRLKIKNAKEINDLKRSYTKRKDYISTRASDPFYNLSKLSPKIRERNEEYTLSLNIPEHESRFVNLTGRNKKLRLTTTRNFEDLAKTEEGGINRSSRSEMISQEFLLDTFINPRKITQVYEDGQLVFKIPKIV